MPPLPLPAPQWSLIQQCRPRPASVSDRSDSGAAASHIAPVGPRVELATLRGVTSGGVPFPAGPPLDPAAASHQLTAPLITEPGGAGGVMLARRDGPPGRGQGLDGLCVSTELQTAACTDDSGARVGT